MTVFYYKAITPAGETLEGQFDLATRDDVIGKLQDAGNIPLDVHEADGGETGSLFGSLVRRSTPTSSSRTTRPMASGAPCCSPA